MSTYDIVVVGGSAGCIEPLQMLVSVLPRGFPAAVFVVMHVPRDTPSALDDILGRCGSLPASHPSDGDPILTGHVYVASPDHHLILDPGVIRVQRGPRENRHRPAIDPLFRTAGRSYGTRVIGVVLSGLLDDGSAGLHAIRALGGTAIVQDPDGAIARQMPEAALRYGGADYVLPAEKIGPKIVELVESRPGGTMPEDHTHALSEESDEANLRVANASEGVGTPSVFACPECHGVLWELKEGTLVRFRCRVGHAYTIASLHQEQGYTIEAALWAALRALEEKSALSRRLSESMADGRMADRFKEQAQDERCHAEIIRRILLQPDATIKPAA